MFTKILVANRGEIALRVIRACQELGVKTVAVYSEADAAAPHVREADEAVLVGPAPSSQSYLVGERLIEVAKRVGAEAVHPGYGFLSERAWFARAVREASLVFIGPPAEAIEAMGSKTAARQLAIAAGVPVVPGNTEGVKDATEALAVAETYGFPVLLKAAAGGGGKGMRIVRTPDELAAALDSARREARNAFGDDAVYLEKYIEGPRHVEIQVLADTHGNVVHLGERECSVQRRHQKMIEEAPSVAVTPELRARMGATAVAAARAAGYVNAGTCEFLLDRDGQFYFLEMNTRIQVEHPVTEEVTGIDLIKQQICVANGEKLGFDQGDIKFEKHAIECRINAEDPARNFAPSPGTIGLYYAPGGLGVRVDSHAYSGYTIPPYYDSMIGKLICFGPTRKVALERAYRALSEYLIRGIKTTIPLHRAIMADPVFIEGKATTAYMEDFLSRTATDLFS